MKHKRTSSKVALQILKCIPAILFSVMAATNSFAQIINTSDIDKICRENKPVTSRNTIVYVDFASLKPGETEWGYTLIKKLELATRERITILGVNPNTFEVFEVFDLCHPTL